MVNPDSVSLTAEESTQTPEEEFQPLTAEEAQAWRERHTSLSVWWVLGVQLALAAVLAVLGSWFWGFASIGMSVMYGALAVVVPAALFARGLTSSAASVNAMTAAVGFVVWQGVKLVLTVLLLALAPRVLNEVSWPALLAGMLLAMKVYWLALAWGRPKTSDTVKLILKS
jgi:ATP synthase protein I